MILAIDPGTNTGWALFKDGQLHACGLGDPRTSSDHKLRDITGVIVEHPVIYPGGRTKNPNDVLKVAVSAGEWGGMYKHLIGPDRVVYVTPSAWKGTVPKKVHQPRVAGKLTDSERDLLFRKCKALAPQWTPEKLSTAPDSAIWRNAVDAVGLGLFHVGR